MGTRRLGHRAVVGLATVAIALAIAPVAAGQGRPMLEEYTLEGSADKIGRASCRERVLDHV